MTLFRFLMALVALAICSCGVQNQLTPEDTRVLKSKVIQVVESDMGSPRFSVIGTTVFNNKSEIIPDVPTFAEHLARKLKSKGYKVNVSSEKSDGPQIRSLAIYPYQMPGLTGLGLNQRSFLGMESPLTAHCNFRCSFTEKSVGQNVQQPVDFKGMLYFSKPTDIKRSVSSWNDLTGGEKRAAIKKLQEIMDESSDAIISQLGL